MVIPDLGGVDEVTVLEILVSAGDELEVDQAVMSLESEKASMDVPCAQKGRVIEVLLKPGDRVKEGDACLIWEVEGENKSHAVGNQQEAPEEEENFVQMADPSRLLGASKQAEGSGPSASPGVRKLARTLGVDIQALAGSGLYGRVTLDDIAGAVKARLNYVKSDQKQQVWQDPTKFGPCEELAFGKIKKATAKAMSESWSNVVHVTQFEKVDITGLEAYRCQHKDALKQQSVRLTLLAFIIKALGQTLQKQPQINASYQSEAQVLWIKKYYHIGFAVDTPQGLVVPVIRDVDQCSVIDIAKALGSMSKQARDAKLSPKDMVGASATVSSLGGIGGEYFTPIVSQPQSVILGVSRSSTQAVWDGQSFQPRLMLPLSLSYDHRVIDGAEAMRFLKDFCETLQALEHGSLGA